MLTKLQAERIRLAAESRAIADAILASIAAASPWDTARIDEARETSEVMHLRLLAVLNEYTRESSGG